MANDTENCFTPATALHELSLMRLIDAPPEKLFRCWTEPALIVQWFTPPPWKTIRAEIDPRAGGASYIMMQGPDGTRMAGRVIDDALYDTIESLLAYAQARGRTLVDVAVGALIAQPVVGSVITGATRAEQIRANAAAATWVPTVTDLAELDSILKPQTTAAH